MSRLAQVLAFPGRRVHEQLPAAVLVPGDVGALAERLRLLAELDPAHAPVRVRPEP